jgi:transposase
MLGLKRLHVQSDDVSKGKCDIAFLALWLYCFIKNTLKEHNIAMSFYEVITELNKIREFQVLGERVIGTLTKKQLELFKAFGIETKGFTVNGR